MTQHRLGNCISTAQQILFVYVAFTILLLARPPVLGVLEKSELVAAFIEDYNLLAGAGECARR